MLGTTMTRRGALLLLAALLVGPSRTGGQERAFRQGANSFAQSAGSQSGECVYTSSNGGVIKVRYQQKLGGRPTYTIVEGDPNLDAEKAYSDCQQQGQRTQQLTGNFFNNLFTNPLGGGGHFSQFIPNIPWADNIPSPSGIIPGVDNGLTGQVLRQQTPTSDQFFNSDSTGGSNYFDADGSSSGACSFIDSNGRAISVRYHERPGGRPTYTIIEGDKNEDAKRAYESCVRQNMATQQQSAQFLHNMFRNPLGGGAAFPAIPNIGNFYAGFADNLNRQMNQQAQQHQAMMERIQQQAFGHLV